MAKKDSDFFDELYEWSARKHSLMYKYVDGAARYLSSVTRGKTLYYLDGFAGKGRYGNPANGVPYKPGSPLIMAELAKTVRDKGYECSIKCINVEAIADNFSTLSEVTAPFGNLVTNYHGEVIDHIDAILESVQGQPMVAFLDPFGIKGLSMTLIERILARTEPTDIWIRFDVGEVLRRWGWYKHKAKGWEAHFGLLQDIYGIADAERLYNEIDPEIEPVGRKRNVLSLYRRQLLSKFHSTKHKRYAAAYRIGSIKDEEKYHLVFAAAKAQAVCLASKIISGEQEAFERDKELYEQEANGQLSLLDLLREVDPDALSRVKTEKLADFIAEKYNGSQMTRLNLELQLCLDGWFGQIKVKELTAAINRLVSQDKAEIIKGTGTISQPKAQILIR